MPLLYTAKLQEKAIATVTTSGQSHILQHRRNVGDNLFIPFQIIDKRNEIQKNECFTRSQVKLINVEIKDMNRFSDSHISEVPTPLSPFPKKQPYIDASKQELIAL